ncbi:tyrosine-type recombinase/integrase [Methylicorpusculum oleiharenae]|uniref:tyrosine-type recombinase/integrase n=1 Tax=Methylicorpusculum oleiharenae TaxID=1338687 RepID=UPI00135B28A7|nr:tyrosine-type recombinase/integrase [Methylicorpusculum oleiharenae]MCD2448901.1 tyrosine-type recombinase/integrase [Methylicorpusculum oleiharenae]MCD2451793.1 tyrosine-type recombinase/integrase [Methylicorpusculum oleiharenae]MCD2453828.1 tyrosine-type recombinase/integrase [Methylicorpusculum oleiharenae]
MLKDAIDTYLAVRRAAGFKLTDDAFYLFHFARFATAQGDTHVKSQTAIAWAGQARTESQRAIRLKAVIRFARFSYAADNRHEIPPQGVFCFQRHRPIPYLYTEAEIQALMGAAARLEPADSFRPLMYRTLIGLLASTGLRISEALGLCFKDIMADGLLIRKTKFGKSRIVPLHPTTHLALEEYLVERAKLATTDDHLFISKWRRGMCRQTVYATFKELLKMAGLPRQSGLPRPRLIDFRHSFASNALVDGPDRRDQVGRHTLALMTYLGHASPNSTFWYLESSPLLMDHIVRACEHFVEENTP